MLEALFARRYLELEVRESCPLELDSPRMQASPATNIVDCCCPEACPPLSAGGQSWRSSVIGWDFGTLKKERDWKLNKIELVCTTTQASPYTFNGSLCLPTSVSTPIRRYQWATVQDNLLCPKWLVMFSELERKKAGRVTVTLRTSKNRAPLAGQHLTILLQVERVFDAWAKYSSRRPKPINIWSFAVLLCRGIVPLVTVTIYSNQSNNFKLMEDS